MSEDRVSITITDGIADVRMTRADKRNALDNAMFAALAAAGERLKTEPGVRVVVLSGEGSSFCAGLDFATMSALAGGGERAADRPAEGNPGEMKDGRITHLGQQVCWVWQEVPVPVIDSVTAGTHWALRSHAPPAERSTPGFDVAWENLSPELAALGLPPI